MSRGTTGALFSQFTLHCGSHWMLLSGMLVGTHSVILKHAQSTNEKQIPLRSLYSPTPPKFGDDRKACHTQLPEFFLIVLLIVTAHL